MTGPAERTAYWDPFDGRVSAVVPASGQAAQSILPVWLSRFELPLFLITLPGFILAVFFEAHLALGMVLITVGMGGGFLINHFTRSNARRRALMRTAAAALNYGYRDAIPAPRRRALLERVPEFFKLRVAGSIPLMVESEMWGEVPERVPFWLGSGLFQSVSLFGGPKQQVATGEATIHGNVLMMIAAYELERDTEIRVQIMPEFTTAIGPLDRDIKTESTVFNDRFNIRMRMSDGTDVTDRATVDLLTVLTPAFQTTLIDLADRFAARVIVDRSTVYFAGFRNLTGLNPTLMAKGVKEAVDAFSAAAVSFKRYAE